MPSSDEIIASMIAALPEQASAAAIQEFREILEMLVAAACKEQIARIEQDMERAFRAFQTGKGSGDGMKQP